MQKLRKFVAISCFAMFVPVAFADDISDCVASGIVISKCKMLFDNAIPQPDKGTVFVAKNSSINDLSSDKGKANTGNIFINSRVYVTEHSHVDRLGNLIEFDEAKALDENVIERARANFNITLDQLERNASPLIRENLSPILSDVKEQINSSSRRSLVIQLVTLVDFSDALHQVELAGRVNNILNSVSPATAKFMQDELGVTRYIGHQINFNSPIGISVGSGLAVEEFYGKNGIPYSEGDFRASELDLGDYSSDIAKLDLLATGEKHTRLSITSHISGYRLDQDTYGGRYDSSSFQTSSGIFSDSDRVWSGVVSGLKAGASAGGTGATVGGFLGGPPGAAGGAVVGASAGFTGGFMTGYSHPDESFASGVSHHTKTTIDVNWSNKEIITSTTVTTVDHKTKETKEEIVVEHEKITVLPEKQKPPEKTDGPKAENNCEGGPCKREVIGCDVPPDMKDSSGSGDGGPLTEDQILERKKEMKEHLNPWVLPGDLDSLLGLSGLRPEGEINDLIQNPKNSFTNWGPDGKPDEGGGAVLTPIEDPLFDPGSAE